MVVYIKNKVPASCQHKDFRAIVVLGPNIALRLLHHQEFGEEEPPITVQSKSGVGPFKNPTQLGQQWQSGCPSAPEFQPHPGRSSENITAM